MIDVVVAGRSLPALQTALDLAEVGLRVVVTEKAQALPEPPERDERDAEGGIAALMHRAAQPIEGSEGEGFPDALPDTRLPDSPLLRDIGGDWAPQPTPNVLGVPAVVLATDTTRLLGAGASLRAYLDRITPLLTVGKTRVFGELVRKRLGAALLRRLVEPQVFERFGVSAGLVEVAIVAPGLNEALSRTGALSSAVLAYSERNVTRETRVAPVGGWGALHAALLRKLELYGVRLLDSPPRFVSRDHEAWVVRLQDGTELESRALVLDQGGVPVGIEAFDGLIDDYLPDYARSHASIDIDKPEWLEPGASALLVSGDWALRIAVGRAGAASAFLRSEVAEAYPLAESGDQLLAQRFDPSSEALRGELAGVLAEAGVTAAPGAIWSIGVAAAPFTSTVERDGMREQLELVTAETPTLLPVGRALHGDDLGVALAWSHRAAIALRRRLLGLDPVTPASAD